MQQKQNEDMATRSKISMTEWLKIKMTYFGIVGCMHGSLFYKEFTKPFYLKQEFWTAAATVVALFMPLVVIRLNNRLKKSKLIFNDISVVHQDSAPDKKHIRKLFDVGRLIITNEGKFKAQNVEAYIDKIVSDGEIREDFFSMPLVWTHGQLSKSLTVRDIYPNQTVYLDIFNHILDPEYAGNSSVIFAIAAGHKIDNLSKMNLGKSEILIKLYQESGQVNQIWLKVSWDGKSVPQISIIKKEI